VSVRVVAVLGRGVVDPAEPVLHADDDALLRGRAAFETLRVYRGRPFRLDEHLARLAASGERLGIAPVDAEALRRLVDSALAGAPAPDAVLRLYLTPGREADGRPRALALVGDLPPDLEAQRARGIALASLSLGVDPDLRESAPWLLGGVKSTSYAVNMAAASEARRRGADDAVFLARGGIVLEAPTSNVWWRCGRTLYTPALELGILPGVTRAVLLERAREADYEVREGRFPLAELARAEEAFTSSSVREVMPVRELDGEAVPLGPAARGLQAALREDALGGPV
jgi:4-amino-4-deoxychorismate lyase